MEGTVRKNKGSPGKMSTENNGLIGLFKEKRKLNQTLLAIFDSSEILDFWIICSMPVLLHWESSKQGKMKQNLVSYQSSTVGSHRPSGLRFKKGLQLAMALAVCIWILYQIKDSSNHDMHRPNQLVKEHGTMLLGRKWKAELMDGGDPKSENGKRLREVEGKEDGGVEDGSDESEIGGGVQGFRDENGVPPDGFELVNWTPYERRQYDQAQASDYSSRDVSQ
ncbi:hypothetical protein PVL29_011371 [Vitis rotundifolia]|uniref:Uncharacterized protein n=1 Tax=Vitis rotundifolia TaxID=103349 RepID=A0AA38ZQ04_VITRO|nr:hypothetical protein PVL29_011371 [Vitis rotundifolia]